MRISSILKGIEPTGLFDRLPARHFSEGHLKEVHDPHFVEYLKQVCTRLEPGKSVYPYVFPIRNAARPPKDLPVRAGYYCFDTFTPLNRNAYKAAKGAVDCALTAARCLTEGYRLAYALGLDPAKKDPTGTWSLSAADFEENGRMIGGLRLPTLIVQEGGYRTRTLGTNARHFFLGLWRGMHGIHAP